MTNAARLHELFGRLTLGKLTLTEEAEFLLLWENPANSAIADDLLDKWYDQFKESNSITGEAEDRILGKILKGRLSSTDIQPEGNHEANQYTDSASHIYAAVDIDRYIHETTATPKLSFLKRKWFRYAAAASIVLCVGASLFIVTSRNSDMPAASVAPVRPVPTVKSKAQLVLADGSIIGLDSSANGQLELGDNTSVVKEGSGEIAYITGAGDQQAPPVFHTLRTLNGGQYQIRLPDGSRVWLNAASSITYPTAFNQKSRTVSITGEAYFEVTHDISHPFHVRVNSMEVQVLGTHFNINAYADEGAIKTTLLEGKVRIRKSGQECILRPHEQALVTNAGAVTIKRHIDVDNVIAWKNGLFNMKGTDLEALLRQISRWYDVEVVVEKPLKHKSFGGSIRMDVNLSDLLKTLEHYDVHSQFKNGKLIIKSS